jgi:type IV pilus biogenesis protein CpaD/CtpE
MFQAWARMATPVTLTIAVIVAGTAIGCTSRDCSRLDSVIAGSKISRIEVINDEEGITNVIAATPNLLRQFSTTNREFVSNYKKRYAPGYMILVDGEGNLPLHYYGDRIFGTKKCMFQIKTTNAITAQFK